MSIEALGFVGVVLAVFFFFAVMTYAALAPMRFVLRLGPQGGVDLGVSLVFAGFVFWMLWSALGPNTSVSRVALLALPVCLAGLLFLGVGLFEAPQRAGERRDRLLVGIALIATAFVILSFGTGQAEYNPDMASSVSNAPG